MVLDMAEPRPKLKDKLLPNPVHRYTKGNDIRVENKVNTDDNTDEVDKMKDIHADNKPDVTLYGELDDLFT